MINLTDRKRSEEALEKRMVALARPLKYVLLERGLRHDATAQEHIPHRRAGRVSTNSDDFNAAVISNHFLMHITQNSPPRFSGGHLTVTILYHLF